MAMATYLYFATPVLVAFLAFIWGKETYKKIRWSRKRIAYAVMAGIVYLCVIPALGIAGAVFVASIISLIVWGVKKASDWAASRGFLWMVVLSLGFVLGVGGYFALIALGFPVFLVSFLAKIYWVAYVLFAGYIHLWRVAEVWRKFWAK